MMMMVGAHRQKVSLPYSMLPDFLSVWLADLIVSINKEFPTRTFKKKSGGGGELQKEEENIF